MTVSDPTVQEHAVVEVEKPPFGHRWRSSTWFITLVVGVGIMTDLGIYSMIIPVIPYRLESLGYTEVASKTSWLLLAYSLALVLSTPPVVWASEKLGGRRRAPLLVGIAFLAGSVVMFMFAPSYAVFVVARVLQGVSGSIVWVVGLALLCDTVPEESVGQQLGLAMTGVTIGFSAGPPLGGVLYQKLGFHAPFVLCLGFCVMDFVARLLVIERRDAVRWQAAASVEQSANNLEKSSPSPTNDTKSRVPDETRSSGPEAEHGIEEVHTSPDETAVICDDDVPKKRSRSVLDVDTSSQPVPKVSQYGAVILLAKHPRAVASLINTLLYGIILTALEPTLTLRLEDVWGLTSLKVGLVYLAGAVPAFFSGAIAGWSADKYGAEWATTGCLLLSLPWFMLLIIRWHLALFIASFCLAMFMLNGMISPATSELAASSRAIPAVTYAHVFGAFNVFYSVGSAIGPIIGGQIYDHVKDGWTVLCVLNTALIAVSTCVTLALVGNAPLLQRIARRMRSSKEPDVELTVPPIRSET